MKKARICKRGHPIPDEDRHCRICHRERAKAHQRMKTAERREELDNLPVVTPDRLPSLEEAQLMAVIWHDRMSWQALSTELGWPMKKVRSLLTELKMLGFVDEQGRSHHEKFRTTSLGWWAMERVRNEWADIFEAVGARGLTG